MADRIKQGMKIEISDVLHPYKLWVATVRTELEVIELEIPKQKNKNSIYLYVLVILECNCIMCLKNI